jgi:hypothetical protein
LSFYLFGRRLDEVGKYLTQTWLSWPTFIKDAYVPPLVQVKARLDDMLPFEFFPLFDSTFPPAIGTTDELLRLAARFLGFSTIVQRFPDASPDQDLTPPPARSEAAIKIDNIPRLPIRFFQHAKLEGARQEKQFFQKQKCVELRGPWPDQALNKGDFIRRLAIQILEATPDQNGFGIAGAAESNEGQQLDQIQHFACHCNTDKTDSLEYSLELLDHAGFFSSSSVRSATIDDLAGEFSGLPQRRPDVAYPLIFLNACGASKLTPKGVTSFPKLFLEIGNRGVIGTETNVPDKLAAAFSQRFYSALIEGKSVGESTYLARRDLLKKNNPLGILYTVYADPDLRVKRPLISSH